MSARATRLIWQCQLVAGALLACASPSAARMESERQIHRLVLEDFRRQAGASALVLADSTYVFDHQSAKEIAKVLTDASARAAVADLDAQTATAIATAQIERFDSTVIAPTPDFSAKWRASLIKRIGSTDSSRANAYAEGAKLAALRELVPGALGVVRLSGIGFSKGKERAAQALRSECGFSCVEEWLFLLERHGSSWRIVERRRLLVS